MSIYKKFTAQDFATIPFNAHKQYNLKDSASLATNKVNTFTTKWTSESISTYSSSSLPTHQLLFDNINNTKYNQIDHLFYKNYKRDIGNKFGNKHYLNHKRELYENANILSIPAGLYGYEIKPGTFQLNQPSAHSQSGLVQVIDDSNGNLMFSSTNVNDYPIDVRSNLLKIDPIKGFKRYDLNTFDGYYNDVFYLDGKEKVDKITHYTSPEGGEYDDSYFFNPIKYEKVQFVESTLGISSSKFPAISFDSNIGSRIVSPDSEKFNFNSEDDFAISFNMKPKSFVGLSQGASIGSYIAGGQVFHIDNDFAYIVINPDPSFPHGTAVTSLDVSTRIQNEFSVEPVPGAQASFSIEFNDTTSNVGQIFSINIQAIDADGNITVIQYVAGESLQSGPNNYGFPVVEFSANFEDANTKAVNLAAAINSSIGHNGLLIAEANPQVGGLVTIKNAHPGTSANGLPFSTNFYFGDIIGADNFDTFAISTLTANPTYPSLFNQLLTNTPSIQEFSGGEDGVTGISNASPAGDEHFKQRLVNTSPVNYLSSPSVNVAPTVAEIGVTASGYTRLNDATFTLSNNELDFGDFAGTPIAGTGRTNTLNLLAQSTNPSQDFPVFNFVANEVILGALYTNEAPWIASYDELVLMHKNIGFTVNIDDANNNNKLFLTSNGFPFSNIGNSPFPTGNVQIFSSNFDPVASSISAQNHKIFTVLPPVQPFTPLATLFSNTINNPGLNDSLATFALAVPPNNAPEGNVFMVQRIPLNFLDENKRYIISKSTTKTVVPTPLEGRAGLLSTTRKNSSQFKNVKAEPQFPFEIYLKNSSLFFERSDGDITTIISGGLNTSIRDEDTSVLCQKSSSTLEIYMNGEKVASGTDITTKQTQNNANLYIGSKGDDSKLDSVVAGAKGKDAFFKGDLSNINIYDNFFTQTQITNISESINGSPYIGNIFYQHGFAVATHPKYQDIFSPYGPELFINPSFQGIPSFTDAADLTTVGPLTSTLSVSSSALIIGENLELSTNTNSNLFPQDIQPAASVSFNFSATPGKIYLLKMNIEGDPASINTTNLTLVNEGDFSIEDPSASFAGGITNLLGSTNILFIGNGNATINIRCKNGFSVLSGNTTLKNISVREVKNPLMNNDGTVSNKNKTLDELISINFQGSHLIYEHEYQCTIQEDEFNDTMNISARKIKSNQSEELADFTTGSLFKPYVTTIGLYNEDKELLVVGKLAQPIRTSDETDTTFVIRWDT